MMAKSDVADDDSTASASSAGAGDLELTEERELDEETSPADPTSEDQPLLYVQLLAADFTPLAGITVEISGDGIPEPRTVETDEEGALFLDDCGPGIYQLSCDGNQATVHTLTQHDLETDDAAYRVILTAESLA
jgi:hypothetical protein